MRRLAVVFVLVLAFVCAAGAFLFLRDQTRPLVMGEGLDNETSSEVSALLTNSSEDAREEEPEASPDALALLIEGPVYRQKDTRWGHLQLGPSSDTIAGYGCTLCCMAMALGSQGFEVAPNELNEQLSANGGFTEKSLLIWGAIERVTEGSFSVVIQNRPDHKLLDRELAKGNPLIAKVLYDGRIYHWVLITGKDERGYLISDPLGKGERHQTMKNYPEGIFAVRYLKKL